MEEHYRNGALRTELQHIFLTKMIHSVPPEESNWKALIVDRAALRILAATLHINELVNEGISIIELIDIRREPLPSIPAIYFLTPTPETIEFLSNESPTQYKSFRIFFTTHLPDYLLSLLKKRAKFIRRVKSFVELNVRFMALESRLFSLDRPAASLPQLHAKDMEKDKVREEITVVSDRLAEVCKMLAPTLAWEVRSDATSFTTRTVASLIKEELDDMHAKSQHDGAPNDPSDDSTATQLPSDDDMPSNTAGNCVPRKATLLIVDRVSDLATPLIHEYSYQAMAHDLLPLNYRKPGGAHIEVDDEKTQAKKFEQLDDEDKDPVWSTIRWLFIQEALEKSQGAFRQFVDSDAAFKIRGKATQDLDIKEMSAAVRALPQSQMKADKHAMHIQAVRACLERSSEMNLTDLSLVEQDLVIGREADGTKVKSDVMVENIIAALLDDNVPISHRARLLILAQIISEGLPGLGGEISQLSSSATFRGRMRRSSFESSLHMTSDLIAAVEGVVRLLEVANDGVARMQMKINPNLVDDGDTVTGKFKQRYAARQALKQSKRDNVRRQKRHGLHSEDDLKYDVARYYPPLRSVMMDLVDNELDDVLFPVTGAISVESIISSLGHSSLGTASDADRQQQPSNEKSAQGRLSGRLSLTKPFLKGESRTRSDDHEEEEDEDDKERVADPEHLYVVFVMGGVSYSEVRAMYEVCSKRSANVIIGGSDILTPDSYLRQLAAVADVVIRLQVMLPPLPLELAVKRAAKKEASAAKGKKFGDALACSGDDGDGSIMMTEEDNEDFNRERQNGEIVEVVESYKKKSGFRMFGKKWM